MNIHSFLTATSSNTNLPSNGGTGFQPVQAQAEACGTKNHLMIATRYKNPRGTSFPGVFPSISLRVRPAHPYFLALPMMAAPSPA
jgi:hypothetical protein